MIDWLALILACVRAIGAVAVWANNRQLITAGGAQAIQQVLRAQADDLQKITDAMAAAGKRFDDAGGLPPPDIKYRD